jgi:D-alanyl-D-alanine carboxypeptidase
MRSSVALTTLAIVTACARAPSDTNRTRADAAQPPAAFVSEYAAAHQFNGTILMASRGQVSYARSFGWANRPFKVPNTNQTRYKIASITKAFTAVLILQLYEQGKLALTSPIKTYLPDYAGEGGATVTIHQLLNHTSGIDNMDKVTTIEDAIRGGVPPYQAPYTSDQTLSRFASGKLVHAPGTTFDYNNADYVVLGKIIERLYGKPYEQVLQERILAPLNLTSTGTLKQQAIVDGLADTYFYRDDLKALVPDFPVYSENWYAAGSMYSTAQDVLTFSTALFRHRLLKSQTLALMIKPGLDDYGYGVWSYETTIDGTKYRVVKRPGRIMGAQTQLYHFVDRDLTIIILSNTGTTDLDEFVAEIGKRVVRS